jgi:putative phosphoribosyl transferase
VAVVQKGVELPAGDVALEADISVPDGATGVVLFAHGSGSGRRSSRNRYVAGELQSAGLGTVLVDLLTPYEDQVDSRTAALRFDIEMLAGRLSALVDGMVVRPPTARLPIGLFGASTGAAAALITAATRPDAVRAVVSRGGRPDLAGPYLAQVRSPTLLIVGEQDPVVVDLNRQAMELLAGEVRLEIVPGATHLFPEPGALERVARLARDWFGRHLGPAAAAPA